MAVSPGEEQLAVTLDSGQMFSLSLISQEIMKVGPGVIGEQAVNQRGLLACACACGQALPGARMPARRAPPAHTTLATSH